MTDHVKRPRFLQSLIAERWDHCGAQTQVFADAATNQPNAVLAYGSDDGIQAVDFARAVGGPALRAMGFQDRAQQLRAVARILKDNRAALYRESLTIGATRHDCELDVDGGIARLSALAGQALKSLPNAPVLHLEDGIGPGSTTGRQQILAPLSGVALHVTALDNPVSGLLEQIAPALIAGVPCIVCPDPVTACVSERLVKLIHDSQILPTGALQLIYNPPLGLVDNLSAGDAISFAGSRSTAQKLRQHPAVAAGLVRLQSCETGLSAAILGSDVAPGSQEYQFFLREIRSELILRAGQRRHAVRRILLPRHREAEVLADLSATLADTIVGVPDDAATQMGALVSRGHLETVQKALDELRHGAEFVSDPIITPGETGGAFLSPVLLHCAKPANTPDVHQTFVQGPVATAMAYDSLCDAIALANLAPCSRYSNVFTNDSPLAQEAAACLTSAEGQIRICGSEMARQALDLSPVPSVPRLFAATHHAQVCGAEDIRHAVAAYMMRTEIHAPPQLLTTLTGRWVEGAETRHNGHPFRKSLETLRIGDQLITETRQITEQDVEQFAHFTGDVFYAHMDREAARSHPFFDDRVAHGQLVVSFANGLLVDPAPGPVLANIGSDNLRFHAPVYFGDSLHVRVTCKEITPRASAPFGDVRWDCCVLNACGAVVARFDLLTLVMKSWPPVPQDNVSEHKAAPHTAATPHRAQDPVQQPAE
ncbi:phenylacetic acid degradation bifunctional protein PaaZ [Phaeobacter inhibens]|uniref:phenylacetic acid degradation bifunctional protein PaaZ n=1 Tax=Phaeobacter inhibens TaxID=221822 RepID=UPI000C9CDA23|nr:phenylacetic acid degradation bifunctional protein PaaZ [Phaeobacter inhibens]AUQ56587.1 phenylacetic acid degradation protein paaN [Phaeobacter inhibens]AUQ80604.1 phenylacetic acid degradation protein paaN [Phaeobacter inhibens]AUR17763.1 phenylacetic acid degradation protein paaN [Phaeobacter inhibens]